MNAPSPQPRIIASQRWDALDVARGIAILAMIVYHFAWDLSFLRLIETNIVLEPAWQWFARSIAGSFLFLAGIGLALAHAEGFRRISFLRRLLKVGGAALAITLVTYFVFPASYIFFGILHAIAVTSVLALPFLRAPLAPSLIVAAFCFAAPWLFTSPALDDPLLDWLGLGQVQPRTNDYVPVLPWFGLVLLGVATGKVLLRRRETLRLAGWRASNAASRALVFAGRKSLPIYLLHQPILLGVLYLLLQVTGPNPAAEAAPFLGECTASCAQSNGDPSLCRRTCGCVVDSMRREGLWPKLAAGQVTPADQARISSLAQQCFARPNPPAP